MRTSWRRVVINVALLLVQLAALCVPLVLVLLSRYAEATGTALAPWSDVRRPETMRALVIVYVALGALFAAELAARSGGLWRWGRRGATMAALGPSLVSAPPAAVPEGSANEKGSANGRQITEGNAEEESAEEGRSGEEGQVAAPHG